MDKNRLKEILTQAKNCGNVGDAAEEEIQYCLDNCLIVGKVTVQIETKPINPRTAGPLFSRRNDERGLLTDKGLAVLDEL